MTGNEYLSLDPKYDGSCPCAAFEVDGTKFRAHCWRVCFRCLYSGLHYEGDPVLARKVKRALDAMGWSSWSLRRGLSTDAGSERVRLVGHGISREQAFWLRVDKGPGCWPWSGARSTLGYGRVKWDGGTELAHRIAYELTNGPIPEGMVAMHTCDNPPCCNPAHLRAGTVAENNADMAAKGRSRNQNYVRERLATGDEPRREEKS